MGLTSASPVHETQSIRILFFCFVLFCLLNFSLRVQSDLDKMRTLVRSIDKQQRVINQDAKENALSIRDLTRTVDYNHRRFEKFEQEQSYKNQQFEYNESLRKHQQELDEQEKQRKNQEYQNRLNQQKLVVATQRVDVLDQLEMALEQISIRNRKDKSKNKTRVVRGFGSDDETGKAEKIKLKTTTRIGQWKKDIDYFRIDGSVSVDRRMEAVHSFNNKNNTKSR